MNFGEGERRCTYRTSSENLTKGAEISAFWRGLYYSWLASVTLQNLTRYIRAESFQRTVEIFVSPVYMGNVKHRRFSFRAESRRA